VGLKEHHLIFAAGEVDQLDVVAPGHGVKQDIEQDLGFGIVVVG